MPRNHPHDHNLDYDSHFGARQPDVSISDRDWADFREEESPTFGGHLPPANLTNTLGVPWEKVFDVVQSIVQLAGNSPNAESWGQTVIDPLKHGWSQELHFSQSKIYDRLLAASQRIENISERDRHLESFVFTGQVLPLNLLLLQVVLNEQTQQSQLMKKARLWFETAARHFVLVVARNSVNKAIEQHSPPDDTWAAFDKTYSKTLRDYSAGTLLSRCEQFKRNFESLWSQMNMKQRLFAIALLKVLGSFFWNMHSLKLMGEICFYWWVPTTTAVSQELSRLNTVSSSSTHVPTHLVLRSTSQSSLSHDRVELSDRKSAMYGFI